MAVVGERMESSSVYVGGLLPNVTKPILYEEFGRFGSVLSIWLADDPPGFAFVNFRRPAEALAAAESMNGKIFTGSRIKVELSTKKPKFINDNRTKSFSSTGPYHKTSTFDPRSPRNAGRSDFPPVRRRPRSTERTHHGSGGTGGGQPSFAHYEERRSGGERDRYPPRKAYSPRPPPSRAYNGSGDGPVSPSRTAASYGRNKYDSFSGSGGHYRSESSTRISSDYRAPGSYGSVAKLDEIFAPRDPSDPLAAYDTMGAPRLDDDPLLSHDPILRDLGASISRRERSRSPLHHRSRSGYGDPGLEGTAPYPSSRSYRGHESGGGGGDSRPSFHGGSYDGGHVNRGYQGGGGGERTMISATLPPTRYSGGGGHESSSYYKGTSSGAVGRGYHSSGGGAHATYPDRDGGGRGGYRPRGGGGGSFHDRGGGGRPRGTFSPRGGGRGGGGSYVRR